MSHDTDTTGPTPSATQSPPTPDDVSGRIREAIREELDEVIPHVVSALKANEAAKTLTERLHVAERALAERNTRPLVAGIRKVLRTARRLEYDPVVKDTLVGELEDLLIGAGYTEFGEIGEAFVPGRHQALEGQVTGHAIIVLAIFEPGLETLGEVVVPAQVRVGSEGDNNPLEVA